MSNFPFLLQAAVLYMSVSYLRGLAVSCWPKIDQVLEFLQNRIHESCKFTESNDIDEILDLRDVKLG